MDTNNTPNLEDFAQRLLKERGVGDVDAELYKQMTDDLTSRLEDRINAALIEKLAPQYLEEAERLIDERDEAKIQEFFATHLSDVSAIISAELIMFRDRYLGAV